MTLSLYSEVVFGTDPVHATGQTGRFDNPSGDHSRRALRARLAGLDRILVFAKAGTRCLTKFTARSH